MSDEDLKYLVDLIRDQIKASYTSGLDITVEDVVDSVKVFIGEREVVPQGEKEGEAP